MIDKRVKLITDIKSVDDLRRLKIEKRHALELKKLELKASLIQLQMYVSPEGIKEMVVEESQSLAQSLAAKYLPSFLLDVFNKFSRK